MDAIPYSRFLIPHSFGRLRAMPIAWESSFDAALAKSRETGRLVMAEFHSPH